MPWTHSDAIKHTHLADTPARARQWAHISNAILAKTGDEAQAIETANGVLKNHPSMKKDETSPAPAKPRKSNLGVGMKLAPARHWSNH